MSVLNGMYLHVVDEVLNRKVEASTHPMETGIDLTDTVRSSPSQLSLTGKIVDYGDVKAYTVLNKIKALMASGSIVEYSGRNICKSFQIISFETTHPNTNHGGADFTMELKETRIAKSSYVPKPVAKVEEKKEEKKNPDPVSLVVGAIVVFKGGPVYVSSDATKAAATRGRSTCKITYTNKVSWATHQYHLVSTDGKGVYGWVDLANIEGQETTNTSGTTNAGTQQVKTGNGTAIYHKVKSGDNIWSLVNSSYKDLKTTCDKVVKDNPSAFSSPIDSRTLQVGAKLLMGYRS